MSMKELAVPALCVLGALYWVGGCNSKKNCNHSDRDFVPQEPTPIYQEVCPEQPVRTKIIRHRIYERTIRTTTITRTPVYGNDF